MFLTNTERNRPMATIERRAGIYRVKIRRKGYPTQSATFQRLTDAKRWAQITEATIHERRHFPGNEAKRHTLTDLIERYRQDVLPHKRPSTICNQRHHLDYWQQQLGMYCLADITPARLVEYRDILKKTRSNATVVRYMAALSHVFTVAVKEWQWMDDNPLCKVRKPKEPRGRVRFLSDNERQRLLTVCKESASPYLYTIVILALSTGARRGEILSLTWQNVDLQRSVITLQDTKNGERRSLHLTGLALQLMHQHARVRRNDTALVFPAPDGRKPLSVRTAWDTAVKRANIPDFRFHDLRHSAASYLAMNGASLAEIAEILGHKTLSMVKRYTHLSEQHTRHVVERMNAAVFGE
jgi:integrase